MFHHRPTILLTALLLATLAMAQGVPKQAPVLPEGSFIAAARGTMQRSGPDRPWVFKIDRSSEDDALQNLTLLPNSLLEEMEQNQADRDDTIQFTVSGPVLLYRGRNYLLPQHVEMETGHAQRPGTSQDEVPATETPIPPITPETPEAPVAPETPEAPEAPETPVAPVAPADPDETDVIIDDDFDPIDQGDSIASIVAQLQEDVGPLKRSVARTQPLAEVPEGTSEGDLLLSRRGRILRDRSGAWVIVLDADASGLMDPTMILLPSSKLVSIEDWARNGGVGRPVLISGEAFSYRGRHFLLPTAWRVPVERPNLK